MNASEIISYILVVLELNPKEFSERIGYNRPQIIYDIQKGKTKRISSSLANKIISAFPQFNYAWILSGQGEPRKEEIGLTTGKEESMILREPQTEYESLNKNTVLLLPISAMGGSLNDWTASVKIHDCERIITPVTGADFAITVTGDSMSPEFPNGSKVLIKRINPDAFIEWGRPYVLDTCNGTIIKILTDSNKPGCIHCFSINPDQKRYAPFDIPKNEIYGIYRVMMCMAVK